MAYQLGKSGLGKFNNFITALNDYDYSGAIKEMLDSKWAKKDSPERAKELAHNLDALAKNKTRVEVTPGKSVTNNPKIAVTPTANKKND